MAEEKMIEPTEEVEAAAEVEEAVEVAEVAEVAEPEVAAAPEAEAPEAVEAAVEVAEEEPKKKPAAKKPAAKKPAAKKAAKDAEEAPAEETKPAAKKAAAKKPAAAAAPEKPSGEKPVLPKPAVAYQGTGRRKNAIARVRVFAGTGKIYCNGLYAEDYFGREALKTFVEAPLRAIDGVGKFDVIALLTGGGLSGQAGALRLGIARALLASDEELRGELKRAGLLSRDPRMVERKKYGLKKARKRPQFSKR